jgi:crossover junction endodeoxyribonuclease RuvC
MFIVGIDPGLRGGICGINYHNGILWSVEMPVFMTYGKIKKLEYDIPRIAALLRACQPDLVCIENVHSMPGQGVSSTFLFGKGFGILLGVVGTLGLQQKLVTPRVWKAKLGVTADKSSSSAKASELFPNCSPLWKLKKHDGLAEAALLAYYGSGEPNLDLIVPGDIWELYTIEVNHNGKTARHSGRHNNSPPNPKNSRARNRKDQCRHPGTGAS